MGADDDVAFAFGGAFEDAFLFGGGFEAADAVNADGEFGEAVAEVVVVIVIFHLKNIKNPLGGIYTCLYYMPLNI